MMELSRMAAMADAEFIHSEVEHAWGVVVSYGARAYRSSGVQ
jgi:hypothetical protein